jgi:hypothetical protein
MAEKVKTPEEEQLERLVLGELYTPPTSTAEFTPTDYGEAEAQAGYGTSAYLPQLQQAYTRWTTSGQSLGEKAGKAIFGGKALGNIAKAEKRLGDIYIEGKKEEQRQKRLGDFYTGLQTQIIDTRERIKSGQLIPTPEGLNAIFEQTYKANIGKIKPEDIPILEQQRKAFINAGMLYGMSQDMKTKGRDGGGGADEEFQMLKQIQGQINNSLAKIDKLDFNRYVLLRSQNEAEAEKYLQGVAGITGDELQALYGNLINYKQITTRHPNWSDPITYETKRQQLERAFRTGKTTTGEESTTEMYQY